MSHGEGDAARRRGAHEQEGQLHGDHVVEDPGRPERPEEDDDARPGEAVGGDGVPASAWGLGYADASQAGEDASHHAHARGDPASLDGDLKEEEAREGDQHGARHCGAVDAEPLLQRWFWFRDLGSVKVRDGRGRGFDLLDWLGRGGLRGHVRGRLIDVGQLGLHGEIDDGAWLGLDRLPNGEGGVFGGRGGEVHPPMGAQGGHVVRQRIHARVGLLSVLVSVMPVEEELVAEALDLADYLLVGSHRLPGTDCGYGR